MNEACLTKKSCCGGLLSAVAWVGGVLGSFAIIGALAYNSVRHDSTVAVDAQRGAVRLQLRKELDASVGTELAKFAIDGAKENKAQLSIARGMELYLSEWKDDAAAGRAKLLERLEASKKAASFE